MLTDVVQTYQLARYPEGSIERRAAEAMIQSSNEERGTVASLATKFAKENNEVDVQGEF